MRPQFAPGGNTAPPSRTVSVKNLPPFVDQNELTRVFAPSPGLLNARLLGSGTAHVLFQDVQSAVNCRNLYHNWNGWGSALACDILGAEAAAVPPGVGSAGAGGGTKRPREYQEASEAAAVAAATGGGGGYGSYGESLGQGHDGRRDLPESASLLPFTRTDRPEEYRDRGASLQSMLWLHASEFRAFLQDQRAASSLV